MNWPGFFIKVMPSFYKRIKNISSGRIAVSRVIALFVFILASSFVLYVLVSRYSYYSSLKEKAVAKTRELENLKKENQRLKHEIELLHTSGRIEGLARERLGLTKPGELAFRVTKTSQTGNATENRREAVQDEGTSVADKEQKEQKDLSWWGSIWRRVSDTLRLIFRLGNQGG